MSRNSAMVARFLAGHNLGPGRHHFPHKGIAEFDHRLDQLAVLLLEDTLVFADLEIGLDLLSRGLLFCGPGLPCCLLLQATEEVQDDRQRQSERAQHGVYGTGTRARVPRALARARAG